MLTWGRERWVLISSWVNNRRDLQDLEPDVARTVEVAGFAWCFSHVDVGNLSQTSIFTAIQTSHFQISIYLLQYGRVDYSSWRWFYCQLRQYRCLGRFDHCCSIGSWHRLHSWSMWNLIQFVSSSVARRVYRRDVGTGSCLFYEQHPRELSDRPNARHLISERIWKKIAIRDSSGRFLQLTMCAYIGEACQCE